MFISVNKDNIGDAIISTETKYMMSSEQTHTVIMFDSNCYLWV